MNLEPHSYPGSYLLGSAWDVYQDNMEALVNPELQKRILRKDEEVKSRKK